MFKGAPDENLKEDSLHLKEGKESESSRSLARQGSGTTPVRTGLPGSENIPLSDEEKQTRNLLRFTGGILIVASVLCFAYQKYIMNKAMDSLNWPTAHGSVVRNELVGRHLHLLYTYEVSKKKYESNKYYIGAHSGDAAENSYILEQHPKGSNVEVHYNPASPEESCLKPGMSEFFKQSVQLLPIAMLVLGVFAGFLSFLGKGTLKGVNEANKEAKNINRQGVFVYSIARATGLSPVMVSMFSILLLILLAFAGTYLGFRLR
ncbi:MAG: DUF3592 domain-containing protein [Cyanobacteria bacterium HKST-UBA01]|nr:DUF3592 domain-containing protein [Cyanobacteria bacterium HKST-UBA01]